MSSEAPCVLAQTAVFFVNKRVELEHCNHQDTHILEDTKEYCNQPTFTFLYFFLAFQALEWGHDSNRVLLL